jgi:hypothetical protein
MQKTYKQYYKELRSHPSKLAHILYLYNLHFYILRDQHNDDGVSRNISLMKEQLAVIHRYKTLQQTQKT